MLVIVDVKPNDAEIPTDAYFAIEEIKDVSNPIAAKKEREKERLIS